MRIVAKSVLWIGAIVLLALPGQAQYFDSPSSLPIRFNESNLIGAAAIDDKVFCCYWPEWTVKQPMVTSVDLSTGTLLWSKSLRIALPALFLQEEGWLLFDSTDGETISRNQTDGTRTFHIVDSRTGAESIVPYVADRDLVIDRPTVHRDRCVTRQGSIVKCIDGTVVGDLGAGEHQGLATEGHFFVRTLIYDQLNLEKKKCLLRKYDLDQLAVARQMEVSTDYAWSVTAARGDLIVLGSPLIDRHHKLACFDLAANEKRWEITLPRSVRQSPSWWQEESTLVLKNGMTGRICPLEIDVKTGQINKPDRWHDPMALLAWHNESGLAADLVIENDQVIFGRWRDFLVMGVDRKNGQVLWSQRSDEHLITRIFYQKPSIGEYIVAESDKGFDILTVATGERRKVTADLLGIEPLSSEHRYPYLDDEGDEEQENKRRFRIPTSLFSSSTADQFWDSWIFLVPVIPILIWIVWAVVRWQNRAKGGH